MNFFEAVKSCFLNYLNFSGRSRRSEFWYFTLFDFIVFVGLTVIGATVTGGGASGSDLFRGAGIGIDAGTIGWVFYLCLSVPTLAVGSRRLHDVGKSGWWQLIWIGTFIGSIFFMGMTASLGLSRLPTIVFLIGMMGSFAAFILLIVWFAKDGQPHDNRYGYSPKYGGEVSAFD